MPHPPPPDEIEAQNGLSSTLTSMQTHSLFVRQRPHGRPDDDAPAGYACDAVDLFRCCCRRCTRRSSASRSGRTLPHQVPAASRAATARRAQLRAGWAAGRSGAVQCRGSLRWQVSPDDAADEHFTVDRCTAAAVASLPPQRARPMPRPEVISSLFGMCFSSFVFDCRSLVQGPRQVWPWTDCCGSLNVDDAVA